MLIHFYLQVARVVTYSIDECAYTRETERTFYTRVYTTRVTK